MTSDLWVATGICWKTETIRNLYQHYDGVFAQLVDRWTTEGRINPLAKPDLLHTQADLGVTAKGLEEERYRTLPANF